MECTFKHDFGKDCDQHEECNSCNKWDLCEESHNKRKEERKQERLNQNRQTNNIKQTEYSELLKHPKWQKKRLEILQRDSFKCKLCRDEETTLHIHHKKYKPNLKPWEYDSEDLITLCEDCHFIIGNTNIQKILYI